MSTQHNKANLGIYPYEMTKEIRAKISLAAENGQQKPSMDMPRFAFLRSSLRTEPAWFSAENPQEPSICVQAMEWWGVTLGVRGGPGRGASISIYQ